jgi:hypothetical protein
MDGIVHIILSPRTTLERVHGIARIFTNIVLPLTMNHNACTNAQVQVVATVQYITHVGSECIVHLCGPASARHVTL